MIPIANFVSCFWFTVIILPALALSQENDRSEVNSVVTEKVRSAIGRSVEGIDGWKEARNELQALPTDDVVPAIVETLRGPSGQRADMRLFAYAILSDHYASETKSGRAQLIAGLQDVAPDVQRICCKALGPKTISQELGQLHAHLADQSTPEDEKARILKTISGWGPYAHDALQTVEAIFADVEAGERLRSFAAEAMLSIGGIERSLEHFRPLDPGTTRIVMSALGKNIGRKGADCYHLSEGKYRKDREKVKKLVLQTVKSPNEAARVAAIEVLFTIYGLDFLIFDSPSEYKWDPEIRTALNALRNDPNERIRNGVEAYFAMDIDEAAKRQLRKQDRYDKRRLEEQQQQESPNSQK